MERGTCAHRGDGLSEGLDLFNFFVFLNDRFVRLMSQRSSNSRRNGKATPILITERDESRWILFNGHVILTVEVY